MFVACWFSERCGEELTFSPDASLTQDVRYDPAVAQFRQEWGKRVRSPISRPHYADQREGPILPRIVAGAWIFLRENTQLVFSAYGSGSEEPEGGIGAVGGVLGSFDGISVTDAGNRFVKFTVMNVIGWSSATRFLAQTYPFPMIEPSPLRIQVATLRGIFTGMSKGPAPLMFCCCE